MDFGEAKFILSKRLNNDQLLIVSSERQEDVVFKFYKKSDGKYVCASCRKLGKSRVITVVDGRIVGKFRYKHNTLFVRYIIYNKSTPHFYKVHLLHF